MANVTAINSGDLYQTTITTPVHTIISDEPIEVGGKDTGVSPDELLASALAACTTITLRMYVRHKGWDVSEIQVKVQLIKDQESGTTTFQRDIHLEGHFDEQQRKRLLAVANACPIHKTLSGPIDIQTVLIP